MQIQVLKSKIHRVKVTDADLNYIGSITIDLNLMEASNIIAGEKVNLKYKLLFNNEVNSDNNCCHINKLYQADDFLYSIA